MKRLGWQLIEKKMDLTTAQWLSVLAFQSAGFVAMDFLAHPFNTLWTVQQTTDNGKLLSFRKAFQQIKRTNGLKGFYAGFTVQAVSSAPGAWSYLKGRELSLLIFGDNSAGQLMQGPLGVCCGSLLWSPAITLMISEQSGYNSMVKNDFNHLSLTKKAQYIWKNSGVRGFYRGTLPLVFSFSISDAFGSWAQAKILQHYPTDERKKLIPQLFSTALAFNMSAILTSPAEIIFARLKLAEGNRVVFQEKTARDAIKTIYSTRGVRGFFNALPTYMLHNTVWHKILPFKTMVDEISSIGGLTRN